jgi:hypothetical protein
VCASKPFWIGEAYIVGRRFSESDLGAKGKIDVA